MIKNSSSLLTTIRNHIAKRWADIIRLDVLTQYSQSDEERNEINHIKHEIDLLGRKLQKFAPSDVFDLQQKIELIKSEILDLQSRFQN
jgi:hypothetical protein